MDVRWRPLIGFPLDIHIWSIGWPMKSPNWKSNGCPNVVHIRSAGRPVEVQIDVHICALCIVQWTSIFGPKSGTTRPMDVHDIQTRQSIGRPMDILVLSNGCPYSCPNVVHIRSAGRPVDVPSGRPNGRPYLCPLYGPMDVHFWSKVRYW